MTATLHRIDGPRASAPSLEPMVQTIDRAWNAAFHRLIEAFHARTGLPCLLNTSLNRRGMPIVETPGEALRLFADTALDAMVLQNVLVTKRTPARPRTAA